MRLCIVRASRGNTFMNELLDVVGVTARGQGVDVIDIVDTVPLDDARDMAYVLIPHEYFETAPLAGWPSAAQRRRTIAFCTEHPGTQWYETSVRLTKALGAAVDINKSAAGESRRRGVSAEHFQLGYFSKWDRWEGDTAIDRPIDVLYMGSADDRRARLLAGYSTVLWDRRCQILVSPLRPKTGGRLDYLVAETKWERMRASQVLINLHRGASRALEWPRVLECICNGCVVVSEHSDDLELLVPGVHLVSAQPESVGLMASHLLDTPDRLQTMRNDAYAFVRAELPVGPSVERLVAIAEQLVRRPRRIRKAPLPPKNANAVLPPTIAIVPPEPTPNEALRMAVKHLIVETSQLRRQIQRLARRLESSRADRPAIVAESPAYDLARPQVTVVISLYNYEREVIEALGSVAVSDFRDLEIVVTDDASTDRSAEAVRSFIDEHPWVPARLLQHPVNRGLGPTRNIGVAHARGEYIFMLDADNRVFPATISRLVELLSTDPSASFTYPVLAQHRHDGPSGLLSAHAWDPDQLREGNYIDAMALLRRDHLLEIGGYTEDPRLLGWEDYDLWCRFANSGRYGLLLPEMLGWYRKNEHSMLSLTDIDVRVASSLIRARSWRLMSGRLGNLAGADAGIIR